MSSAKGRNFAEIFTIIYGPAVIVPGPAAW